jgi:prepilin-type N-terminal cleavage/methylation domain-containing protein
MRLIKRTAGYTFVELMVAISIFSMVMVIVASIAINFNASQQRERARNLVIEETQFLMSRITEAIRVNAIDYAEYYSNYTLDPAEYARIVYANHPREYDWHFYYLPTCETGEIHGQNFGLDETDCDRLGASGNLDLGKFDTGADDDNTNDDFTLSALKSIIPGLPEWPPQRQLELYLIDSNGTKKTIFRRVGNGEDDDTDGTADEDQGSYWLPGADGNIDGGERLAMLEAVATRDIDNDPYQYKDFEPGEDFKEDDTDIEIDNDDFVPITPKNIDIVDLQFFISPLDDPRKAFAEGTDADRVQPHVTVLLTTRAGAGLRGMNAGDTPLTLQATVSSRILTPVIFPDTQ